MTKEEKQLQIDKIASSINGTPNFYLADISGMNAETTILLRKACHKKGIKLAVVKNTLLKKALDTLEADYSEVYDTLKGNTSIMFSETGNAPARLIKEFNKKHDKPVLKAAYVEESIYVGADQLPMLVEIKSKDELLGEIIGLLQSPATNVISALKAQGGNIAGILQTLAEKGE
ncbi:MAG: large subunit ribosomal protein L10 [Flavobacteriales bacterium]|jgi:large subunit ribosomal protein L10